MKSKITFYLFILLTFVYMILVVSLPPSPTAIEKYDLSNLSARIISLAVVIPFLLVWYSALYGFMRVKSYAFIVKDEEEGKPFSQLATGLTILAFSLPVTGIASALLGYIAQQNTDFLPTATILRNYLNLAFSVFTFVFLYRASEGFLKTFKSKADKLLALPKFYMPTFVILSGLFIWLVVDRPGNLEANSSSYFLPNWLLVFTIAVPYLYVWYLGSIASYRLYVYTHEVKGTIYKQAFVNLFRGTAAIVFTSIFLQLVTTLSARVNRLNLTPTLALIYILVILYAVGFGFVANGAKKLKKIEEA